MKQVNLGGQAVFEGVMIVAPEKASMAVRKPDGTIDITQQPTSTFAKRHGWAKWPVVRGVVNLCTQLALGYRMLNRSMEIALAEEEEEETSSGWMGVISALFAVVLAVGLFMLLPTFLAGLLTASPTWLSVWEGVFRLVIFALYLVAMSLSKDLRRVFMYHGAEHRVLHCIEHEVEPTVENSKRFPVVHPRCGTSFLFLAMVVSIVVFSLFGRTSVLWLRLGLRIVLLPLVIGLSYEILKLAARSESWWARILRAPGLLLQRLSTKVPTDDMIEVAAVAYKVASEDD